MLISFYSNLLKKLKPKQRLLTEYVSILITLQGCRKTFFCTKKCGTSEIVQKMYNQKTFK
jgi:hypothetical protein